MITDTEDFFDLDDFAEQVTLNGRRVKAIFDTPRVQYQEGFAQVVGNTPQLTVQTADVTRAKVEVGAPVIVRKTSYTVSDVNDDSTGITVLYLHKA